MIILQNQGQREIIDVAELALCYEAKYEVEQLPKNLILVEDSTRGSWGNEINISTYARLI